MPTRLLIVEDSRTQAEALRGVLEPAELEVVVARDAEEALRLLPDAAFDIVITDVIMPGALNGYDLCRQIKRDHLADVPVILLTSLSDPMAIINGLECGADNFLTKPYDPEYLLERIRFLLANRRRRGKGRMQAGVLVKFMGQEFTVTSDREQILDLLITTFENAVRQNHLLRQREAELVQARAELERHAGTLQARMAGILDTAEDAIVSVDEDQRIVVFNRGAEKVFGYTAAEAIGQPLNLLVPKESAETHSAHMTAFASTPETGRRIGERSNVRGRRKDGTDFPAEASICKLQEHGRTLFTAILRDVTERRNLERQFHQAQKMEAVGRLAGGVAHDFNNLLTVILGETELALVHEPPAALVQSLGEIRDAGQRAAALTRQLLTFSRQDVAEPTVLNPNRVVTEVDRMLRRVIGEEIELTVTLEPEPWSVRMDRGQLEQVLMNLVVNARDAMAEGGRLHIETANVTMGERDVEVRGEIEPGEYVQLAVTDSGTGIAPEVLERMFEPFFTTKDASKGTGLGLATVYGIVKEAGGRIGVYSELGLGTTMKVYLPRSEEQPTVAPKGDATNALRGKETILIVEDQDQVRRIADAILKQAGYRTICVASGDEALAILDQDSAPIDLLLTDMVLAGIRGPELAERALQRRPGLKILFMSGYSREVWQGRQRDLKAPLVQKPFTPQTLGGQVRAVLDAPEPGGRR